ncbi:YheV family putative zinc ribbon protein [Siccibacter turicensis]|uniref:Uncharacterized protein n=1 Tax=Siccibacter turicensis TaxID=357233 RepID=A0A2P8VHQ6_9ENTR|nr:YheV family putative zinc ribbon protein [Siccibacter turicensis]MDY0972008.1 YheV family putative zinc ribbon protein [Siccibacter turicensis]PSN07057.1 hypothetical protein C7G83_12375 [Siccibacter turicensis]
MSQRKRFIAGAVCPACKAQDSMAMWRENSVDVVECVKCGHQMREADKAVREHVRKEEQVIGIFHPD